MAVPEPAGWPATEVMTSPAARPALAAGLPGVVPAIVTPEENWALEPAILTPRKAVAPMCTVDEAWPASIWRAMDRAVLIGIEYPCVVPGWPEPAPLSPKLFPLNGLPNWNPEEAAVSTPITSPWSFTSGPPESPGWMFAFVSISPVSCSDVPELSSDAVIDWLSAVTVPGATDGVPPTPPALPRATTLSPTLTLDESPVVAVVRPDAPDSRSTAMSWLSS